MAFIARGRGQEEMAVAVFFSYSHQDESLRDKLAAQLRILERKGAISTWHDRKILAGEERAKEIDGHLNSADIILLLVSADFLASDSCWEVEVKRAMELHKCGKARVIPIPLRPCQWQDAPFGQLSPLPKNGNAVTSWKNQDEAFDDIARGIREVAYEFLGIPLELASEREAVCRFLEAIEEQFKYLKFFHTSRQIALKDQYIPIQVTLERRYQHEVETTSAYQEGEAELRRIYALKGFDEEKQKEEIKKVQIDWKEAKKEHNRIIILADPGMGKSTLLKMEAVTIAREELEKLGNDLPQPPLKRGGNTKDVVFPLLIQLSDLAESEEEIVKRIPQLIERDYQDCYQKIEKILKEKLALGNCILLLDALDQVQEKKRIKLKEKLTRFLKNNSCKVIATSRIVGYGGNFLEAGKEMEIVPFTQKQTAEYIQIWFANAEGYLEDESVSAIGLIEELRQKPQINGLAQNPLLLSLICSLYQKKELVLPARRSQLYEKAVTCMLKDWRKERGETISPWKVKAKIKFLEKLAYDFSCESKEVFSEDDLDEKTEEFFREDQLPSSLRNSDTNQLLTELTEEDGIIQKFHEEGKQYLFLHRTFQEYFTACYLNQQINRIELVKEYLWDYDWHETLILLAGLQKEEDKLLFITAIYQHKDDIFHTLLLLAGRCIIETRYLSHPLINEIVDKIYSVWYSHPNFNFMTSSVITLGQICPEIPEKLKNNLKDSDKNIRRTALAMIIDIGTPEAMKILISALEEANLDNQIKCLIVKFLGKMGTPDATAALISATKVSDRVVRRAAKAALKNKISSNPLVNNVTIDEE